ncbi:MAG TPA: AAA family ATPase [Polyangiaceae bacterium]
MICERCGSAVSESGECPRCAELHPKEAPVRAGAPAVDDAEYRQITVLFCDLVGSTALSEAMDAEDLRVILREYQRRAAGVIREYRGHVAQFLGDGIMAYFGYPTADERTPVAAVEAGLALIASMAEMQREFPTATPQVRVGIHSGSVLLGEMGDALLPQRLAVGTTPNLAARAQAEAEAGSVVVTATTHRLVEGYFDSKLVGARQLRGVAQPIMLYRISGRGPASTRLQAAEHRGLSPFVGRERELGLLLERSRTIEDGPPGVVLVGEPGIGKSRLVREFTRVAGDRDVIECSGVEHHESDALYPILTYLTRWANALGHTRESLPERLNALGLSQSAGELLALLPSTSGTRLAPGALPTAKQYQRTIDVLCDFVAALARTRPAILVVEDAQWLDPSTRNFLQAFCERRPHPAFVLTTARTGADLDWANSGGFELVPLARLDEQSARTIATRITEGLATALPPHAVERLLERAEGVPLFIEESARAHAEILAVPPRVTTILHADLPQIPETLRDSLAARLDRLGPARRLAQLASVIGRTFSSQWLQKLAFAIDGTTARLRDLDALLHAGLVHARPDHDGTYEFSHALVRDAAYQSLMRGARAEYHRTLAAIITGDYPQVAAEQPLMLAHHYELANEVVSAATHLLSGARRSLSHGAFTEAMDIARRALDLVQRARERSSAEPVEVELLTTLGLALISTRGYSSPDVEEVYGHAAQICERRGDTPLHVLYGIWSLCLVRSDATRIERLRELFQRQLGTALGRDDALVVRSCLGVHACFAAQLGAARDHLYSALELLERDAPAAQHERLLSQYGFEGILTSAIYAAYIEAIEGRVMLARTRIDEVWQLAERIGHPYTSCSTAVSLSMLARDIDDPELVRVFVERALTLSAEHGLWFWQAIALCGQGWLLALQSAPAEALNAIQSGISLIDAVGAKVNRGYFQGYLVDVLLNSGQPGPALEAVDHGLVICRSGLQPMLEPDLLRRKGRVLAALQQDAAAEAEFRAALGLTESLGMRSLGLRTAQDLALLLHRQGRDREACHLFDQACRDWPEGSSAPVVASARRTLESAGLAIG